MALKETIEALKNKGNAKFKAKEFTEADRLYTEALKLDPENPILLYNRGFTRFHEKMMEEALSDLRLSSKFDPEYIKPIYMQAKVLVELKRFEEANEMLLNVLEMDINIKEAYELLYQLASNEFFKILIESKVDLNEIVTENQIESMEASLNDLKIEGEEGYKIKRLTALRFWNLMKSGRYHFKNPSFKSTRLISSSRFCFILARVVCFLRRIFFLCK